MLVKEARETRDNKNVIIQTQIEGARMFEVEFYEDHSGSELVKEFIINLQAKSQNSKTDRVRANKVPTYSRLT